MDDEPDHSATVARLALELFDLTEPWHGATGEDRELLEAAALLANVGLFISHDGHHKHAFYVIRNSEHLAGFTDNEIELIAQVARYHRKSPPKQSHEAFGALAPDDQRRVRVLAGVLRVAIGLDRTHDGAVADLNLVEEDDALVIEVTPRPGASLDLELFTATERRGLLEEVVGRPVRIEASPASER
jgi:exopolyphosphatase/guanosine-5'-triphosphate,3'-diphosphate pyrophosphatase